MDDEKSKLPPNRSWQPAMAKCFAVMLGGSLLCALVSSAPVSAQPAAEEEDAAGVTEQPEQEADAPSEAEDAAGAEPAEADEVEKRTKIGSRLLLEQELPEPAKELGYPIPKRGVGMPANVETDLDDGFPKRGSVLPSIPPPRPYFEFKEGLYDRIGLKVAFNYSMIALGASSAKPAGEDLSQGKQSAWAGHLLIEAQWVLYQREKDYPGSLVAAFDWRHTLQNTAIPAFFSLDTGSLWPNDFFFLDWRPWFPVLFYEQAFKKVGSEPGWIFKAHGSKQIDRWVVYGNYTFNS